MTEKQISEFESTLLEFVKRASKEEATEAEIAALPAVASVLASSFT